jgi:hypothetical protein
VPELQEIAITSFISELDQIITGLDPAQTETPA